MKTRWPDDLFDRALSARNPQHESELAGFEQSPQARTLLGRLLATDPGAAGRASTRGMRWPSARSALGSRGRVSRPGRRRIIVAGLATAIAAAVAVPLGLRSNAPVPSPPSRDVAAARVLQNAALVAAVHPLFPPLQAGQLAYTREIQYSVTGAVYHPDTFAFRQTILRQDWLAPDGAGRTSMTWTKVSFVTPRDRARWKSDGSPNLLFETNATYGPGGRHPDLSKVPTNAKRLSAMLFSGEVNESGLDPGSYRAHYRQPVSTVFANVGHLLDAAYASPALRAALYEVAATLPGVRLLGAVTDSQGHAGTAVALTTRAKGAQISQINELIFDPHTSSLLESRIIGAGAWHPRNPDACACSAVTRGEVLQSETYVAQGVVNSTTEVPPSTGPGPLGS